MQYYKDEYIFESLSFIKLILVMFGIFLTIESSIILKYDFFLLSRVSKLRFIASKVITLLIINISISFILLLIMWIIALIFSTYLFSSDISFIFFLDLAIFASFYSSVSLFIVLHINNLFSLIIVLVGYFTSSISIDYLSDIEKISSFVYIIQIFFVDYTKYLDLGYRFLYSRVIVMALITILLVKILIKYNENDL